MQVLDKVIYTAKAHTTGGRDGGVSRTDDGRLEVRFAVPGASENGTNPEQLFAAGWSACFISAMKIAAHKMKVTLPPDLFLDSEVDLRKTADAFGLAARLNIGLPGLDRAVAEALVREAEGLCPYSRAIRGNVDVAIKVV